MSLLLLVLLALSDGALSQGLVMDDQAYDRLPRYPDYGSAGSKAEDTLLRNTPKVDLRPYCPRPQHQGAIGSCTGWSTGYGAMSILQAIEKGWEGQTDSITQHAFSALYLYNQVKIGSCQGGAYIQDAAHLAMEEGNTLSSEYDRFKNDCERLPGKSDSLAALPHRIREYLGLFGTEDAGQTKIQKTKLSLAARKPVVIAMMLRNNFQACTAEPPYWSPSAGDTSLLGAHAMVVVGYDDGRGAFEIMNSWGKDWGNGGFIWVKYADFARYCVYAIQLTPREASGKEVAQVRGTLIARTPVYTDRDQLNFQPDSLRYEGEYYTFSGGVRKLGHLVQWIVPRLTAGTYLYAFSLDADGSVGVHWPRDGAFDDRYDGQHESALIAMEQIGLHLPGEYGALRFSKAGRETLCFLISRSPITDFNQMLEEIRQADDVDLPQQLEILLRDRIPPEERVDFQRNELAFTAQLEESEILPLIVQVAVAD